MMPEFVRRVHAYLMLSCQYCDVAAVESLGIPAVNEMQDRSLSFGDGL
jgi:hypothetical protein